MYSQLVDSCTQFMSLRDPGRVLVAVSGGMDSVFLFHVLAEVCSKNEQTNLEILHVNYGLRGAESDGDEAFVRELAKQKNCPVHVLRVSESSRVSRSGESLQEWARRVRYEWFHSLLHPGDVLALAHHQDDLAENVLLRLSRGSRVSQSLGMETFQSPYWRPLLHVSKADIEETVRGQSLPYREDSSNDKLFYGRNRVRHEVLPVLEQLYPQAKKRLVGAVDDVRIVYEYVRKLLEPSCVHESLEKDWLNQLPRPVQREAIELYLEHRLGERRLLPEALYEQVSRALAHGQKSWAMELPQGGMLMIEGKMLRFRADYPLDSQPRYTQYREKVLAGQVGAQLGQNARIEWQATKIEHNTHAL